MKLIIKYYKLILITMVALGIVIVFFGKYFLILNANHLSENFYLQNFNALESGDALALVPRLNALTSHDTVKSIILKKDNVLFFSYRTKTEAAMAFFHRQTVVSDSTQRIQIEIESQLSLQTRVILILFWLLISAAICATMIFRDHLNQVKEAAHLQLADLAKQVAHDIRAPVSALNVVTATLQNISEDQKNLIKSATKRINDIANDLLAKGKIETAKLDLGNKITTGRAGPSEVVVIQSALEELIDEKKIEFSHQKGVTIKSDLITTKKIEANLNESDLKRLLSNLINNSMESFEGHEGIVTVSLREYSKNFTITISDNGKGIPEDILPKLTAKGVSFGKNKGPNAGVAAEPSSVSISGSGLGLYHAKTTVLSWGGDFLIKSKMGTGTMVTLTIPFSRRTTIPDRVRF